MKLCKHMGAELGNANGSKRAFLEASIRLLSFVQLAREVWRHNLKGDFITVMTGVRYLDLETRLYVRTALIGVDVAGDVVTHFLTHLVGNQKSQSFVLMYVIQNHPQK